MIRKYRLNIKAKKFFLAALFSLLAACGGESQPGTASPAGSVASQEQPSTNGS